MVKLRWKKTGKVVGDNGEYNILYSAEETDLMIESRKRAIPHANNYPGYWLRTTYFLISGDKETEYSLLCLAKKAAEELEEARRQA